jgi:hypothetical protein
MWVEAILTRDDLAAFVAELCPLTIALGQATGTDHYLRILNPKDVVFVEDRGLRLTCEAEILWPVLRIDVPIRIESLTLMLELEVEAIDGEEVIRLKPALESLDVSWVPHLVDLKVTDKINQELAKVDLGWRFFRTLSQVFDLPSSVAPVDALDVRVAWGKLRVTPEAMVLAVSFHTRVLHVGEARLSREAFAPKPAPPAKALAPASAAGLQVRVPMPIAIAGGAALVGVASFLAFRAVSSLGRALLVRD